MNLQWRIGNGRWNDVDKSAEDREDEAATRLFKCCRSATRIQIEYHFDDRDLGPQSIEYRRMRK